MSQFDSHDLRPFFPGNTGVRLQFEWARAGSAIEVCFKLTGNLQSVVLSAPSRNPLRRDELWKKTCFEVFIAPRGKENYWEINLSSSGDWSCYAFARYRNGMRPEERVQIRPRIFKAGSGSYRLRTKIDLSEIVDPSESIDLAPAAILQGPDGENSFWAIKHAGHVPDFHLRAGFTIST